MIKGKNFIFNYGIKGNLALKKQPSYLKIVNNKPTLRVITNTHNIKKEELSSPKILTLKIRRENRIYCGCWQLNGDDDC